MTNRADRIDKESVILRVARGLFFSHGTRRTTVTDICKEAQISKMTFYRRFRNKNTLVLRVIAEIFDDATSNAQNIMDKEMSFCNKIEEIIAMKIRMLDEYRGELFLELLDDESEERQASRSENERRTRMATHTIC